MAEMTIRQLKKSYGTFDVLHSIDLDVHTGEFMVFVGPSGCGKSTLLRCIAGLEDISAGELRIENQLMNDVPPSKRGIAKVFQSYALYPHMTLFDNMAFGLKIAGVPKAEIKTRVSRAAEVLKLAPYLDRYPRALSGGQRQRVAIGRAIVRDPRVFLFDEPLSNLDAALRVATRIEIAKLKESMPDTTMIYVTHDQVEAMTLADRIVVLKDGRIEQVGSPQDLYRNPANVFVARFIGSPAMNILSGEVADQSDGTISVRLFNGAKVAIERGEMQVGEAVQVGVRPEDLTLAHAQDALIDATIDHVEHLGEVQLVHSKIGEHSDLLVAKLPGEIPLNRGAQIKLGAASTVLHLFDSEGRRINGPASKMHILPN